MCERLRPLTEEHILPRAVGNNKQVDVPSLYAVARGWRHGQRFQNGLVKVTLCGECNSMAGRRYVPAFAAFTWQAVPFHAKVTGKAPLLMPFIIRPLAVMKQLAVMTLAMSPPGSVNLELYRGVREFAMRPWQQGVFPGFRFFCYLHHGEPAFEPLHVAMDVSGGPSVGVQFQVGLAPLGYIVTADDPQSVLWARNRGLCELTRFAERDPRLISVEHLAIPPLIGAQPLRPMPQGRQRATKPPTSEA